MLISYRMRYLLNSCKTVTLTVGYVQGERDTGVVRQSPRLSGTFKVNMIQESKTLTSTVGHVQGEHDTGK